MRLTLEATGLTMAGRKLGPPVMLPERAEVREVCEVSWFSLFGFIWKTGGAVRMFRAASE